MRLTDAEGPDILVKAAAGGGSAYAAWQGFRNGQSDVFLSSLEGDKWSVPVKVSESTANDWAPAVAVDRKGRAWIVWDSYEKNSYNILARSYSAGQLSPTVRITDSSQFHANADVAVDAQDRPWFAWEESEANWGKDYAFLVPSGRPLYQDRRIRVGVLDGSEIRQPNDSFVNSLPENLRRYNHNAQLRFDSKGRLWLLFRSRTFARLADEAAVGEQRPVGEFRILLERGSLEQSDLPVPEQRPEGKERGRDSSRERGARGILDKRWDRSRLRGPAAACRYRRRTSRSWARSWKPGKLRRDRAETCADLSPNCRVNRRCTQANPQT